MKKKLAILALCLIVFLPTVSLAANVTPTADGSCTGERASLARCVNQVYVYSMAVAAILALVMIVIGGYITLTAAGNAQRASDGRKYINSSIIGLILLFGAYILLYTINPDLVDFNDQPFNDRATDIVLPPNPTPPPTVTPGK